MKLSDWIDRNLLDVKVIEPDLLFEISEVGRFLIVKSKLIRDDEGDNESLLLFNQSFELILDDFESALADSVDFFTFCFGGKWYYFSTDSEPELIPLKYLGKVKLKTL